MVVKDDRSFQAFLLHAENRIGFLSAWWSVLPLVWSSIRLPAKNSLSSNGEGSMGSHVIAVSPVVDGPKDASTVRSRVQRELTAAVTYC